MSELKEAIMKTNNLVIITIGLLIMMLTIFPVSGIENADGYEMKYHDYNPLHTVTSDDVTGSVIVFMRAGGSAEDLSVYISRDESNATPFDNYYHPDRTEVVNQNTLKDKYLKLTVLPDGVSVPERLTPGNFTAYLRNGNGGQPEQQSFTIGVKSTSYVQLLGHAVSSFDNDYNNKLKIIHADYGTWFIACNEPPRDCEPECNEDGWCTDSCRGTPDNFCSPMWRDVTSIIRNRVYNGELHISHTEYSSLFNDPNAENMFLLISYEYNGVAGSKTIGGNEDLNIP
jgi:hypothetical protein